jgi:hypothetical protein
LYTNWLVGAIASLEKDRSMPITLSLDRFPIVHASLVGTPTDAELVGYLDQIVRRVFSRNQRFVVILDATQLATIPSARHRQLIADWTTKNVSVIERLVGGAVMVTESPLMRGIITAIQWLAPSRVQRTSQPTLQAAEKWAMEQLYGPATLGTALVSRRPSAWPRL